MTIPRNVLRFEVLLYLSLLIDSLSAAFLDRGSADVDPETAGNINLVAVLLLIFFIAMVWLAARQRRNWARWVLVAALGLSMFSLFDSFDDGLTLASIFDVLSTGLTAAGLYCSFTGDAKDWFNSQSV